MHVQKTVSRCFVVLRQLRSIRHSVTTTIRSRLLSSRWYTVEAELYGIAVLAGLPAYLFRRLQSVMNAAARLIYGLRHSDQIYDSLMQSHHLPLALGSGEGTVQGTVQGTVLITSNMTLIMVDKPQQLQLVKRDKITVNK